MNGPWFKQFGWIYWPTSVVAGLVTVTYWILVVAGTIALVNMNVLVWQKLPLIFALLTASFLLWNWIASNACVETASEKGSPTDSPEQMRLAITYFGVMFSVFVFILAFSAASTYMDFRKMDTARTDALALLDTMRVDAVESKRVLAEIQGIRDVETEIMVGALQAPRFEDGTMLSQSEIYLRTVGPHLDSVATREGILSVNHHWVLGAYLFDSARRENDNKEKYRLAANHLKVYINSTVKPTAVALMILGVSLERSAQREEAVEVYRRSVKIESRPETWEYMGDALVNNRQAQESLACYDSAFVYSSRKRWSSVTKKACAWLKLGKSDSTRKYLEEAVTSDSLQKGIAKWPCFDDVKGMEWYTQLIEK